MKPWLRKSGIIVFLGLLPIPMALGFSANPLFVYPAWSVIGYILFRFVPDPERRASALPLAFLCGDLAWLIYVIMSTSGETIVSWPHAALLIVGMTWLFFRQSRSAALALVALELLALLNNGLNVLINPDASLTGPGGVMAMSILTFRIAAIGTLIQFALQAKPFVRAATIDADADDED